VDQIAEATSLSLQRVPEGLDGPIVEMQNAEMQNAKG
jgi:hypothetical protein